MAGSGLLAIFFALSPVWAWDDASFMQVNLKRPGTSARDAYKQIQQEKAQKRAEVMKTRRKVIEEDKEGHILDKNNQTYQLLEHILDEITPGLDLTAADINQVDASALESASRAVNEFAIQHADDRVSDRMGHEDREVNRATDFAERLLREQQHERATHAELETVSRSADDYDQETGAVILRQGLDARARRNGEHESSIRQIRSFVPKDDSPYARDLEEVQRNLLSIGPIAQPRHRETLMDLSVLETDKVLKSAGAKFTKAAPRSSTPESLSLTDLHRIVEAELKEGGGATEEEKGLPVQPREQKEIPQAALLSTEFARATDEEELEISTPSISVVRPAEKKERTPKPARTAEDELLVSAQPAPVSRPAEKMERKPKPARNAEEELLVSAQPTQVSMPAQKMQLLSTSQTVSASKSAQEELMMTKVAEKAKPKPNAASLQKNRKAIQDSEDSKSEEFDGLDIPLKLPAVQASPQENQRLLRDLGVSSEEAEHKRAIDKEEDFFASITSRQQPSSKSRKAAKATLLDTRRTAEEGPLISAQPVSASIVAQKMQRVPKSKPTSSDSLNLSPERPVAAQTAKPRKTALLDTRRTEEEGALSSAQPVSVSYVAEKMQRVPKSKPTSSDSLNLSPERAQKAKPRKVALLDTGRTAEKGPLSSAQPVSVSYVAEKMQRVPKSKPTSSDSLNFSPERPVAAQTAKPRKAALLDKGRAVTPELVIDTQPARKVREEQARAPTKILPPARKADKTIVSSISSAAQKPEQAKVSLLQPRARKADEIQFTTRASSSVQTPKQSLKKSQGKKAGDIMIVKASKVAKSDAQIEAEMKARRFFKGAIGY